MKLLEGKVALITGASKGIGKSIAMAFAEQGATVAFTYLSSVEKGQALEKELSAKGVTADQLSSNRLWKTRRAGKQRRHHSRHIADENERRAVGQGDSGEPEVLFQYSKSGHETIPEAKERQHHQHDFRSWPQRKCRPGELCCFQCRHHRLPQYQVQCDCTRIYRNRNDRRAG